MEQDVKKGIAYGSGYGEVAYGYSRRLSSWITVGARAKLLLGVESLDYNMTRLDVSASEEAVTASVEANLDLTSRWATIPADEDGYYHLRTIFTQTRRVLPRI